MKDCSKVVLAADEDREGADGNYQGPGGHMRRCQEVPETMEDPDSSWQERRFLQRLSKEQGELP